MRLFVAADLDQAARAAVAAEQTRLRALDVKGAAIRWVRSEHLHLTLLFIGEVDDAPATALAAALEPRVRQRPFEASFGGLGVFPDRGAPRALWIGVRAGEAELIALAREVTARVSRAGISVAARALVPHLTIGRWKGPSSSARRRVQSVDSHETLARVRIDRATLYQSRPSSAGPTYIPLAHATLAVDDVSCR